MILFLSTLNSRIHKMRKLFVAGIITLSIMISGQVFAKPGKNCSTCWSAWSITSTYYTGWLSNYKNCNWKRTKKNIRGVVVKTETAKTGGYDYCNPPR